MARQLSTSLSDGLLVWSVLYFIYHVFWTNCFACIGVGIQGAAAFFGVLRFASARTDGQIYDYHLMTSWMAQVLGVPLLAVGFCHKDLPIMMNLNLMFSMGVLIGSRFLAPGMRKMATEACSGFAMLTILIVNVRAWNLYGILGFVMYIISGAVVGSEGKIGFVYRVDILHVLLIFGNIFFTKAILSM